MHRRSIAPPIITLGKSIPIPTSVVVVTHKVAWAAIKEKYEKSNNRWVAKQE